MRCKVDLPLARADATTPEAAAKERGVATIDIVSIL